MVLEIILFTLALTVIAGYTDLRTTEVPDEIPALLIAGSLFYWYLHWGIAGDAYPLLVSLIGGTLLLALGLLLYRASQWGGADAWLLGGIAYALPLLNGRIFIIDYIFNFFLVTIIYMAVYSIALGARHRHAFSLLRDDLKKSWRIVAGVPAAYAVFVAAMLAAGYFHPSLLLLLALIAVLMVFWRYARIIEHSVFKRRIPARQLRVGDVLADGKWVGITHEQAEALRKAKEYVVVKEGVRFVPVFAITLVVTLLLGNVLFLIF